MVDLWEEYAKEYADEKVAKREREMVIALIKKKYSPIAKSLN